ncbi:MAG: hypothetical protein QXY83_05970, partial [Thermosphaera sp.]
MVKVEEEKMSRKIWVAGVVVLLSALLAGCARFFAPEPPAVSLEATAPPPGVPGAAYAPDQILVRFKPGVLPEKAAEIHARLGGQVVQVIPKIDVHVVRIPLGRVPDFVQA